MREFTSLFVILSLLLQDLANFNSPIPDCFSASKENQLFINFVE